MVARKKLSKAERIEDLLTRGVVDIVDRENLERALRSGKKLRVKLGFDPTGAKIHIGRAIILRKLKAFQDLGHQVVFIVGDFTARVGDPSDKLGKRPMLDASAIKENLKRYRAQVGKIIDLEKAEFHYNSRWLAKLTFQEIAELAESFSVQQMVARRNFKERWEKGEEISLRELLYPLMQGYDSVAVKADVELGGTDQLFNLHAGRVIQHFYRQKRQDLMTTEMLEGTDGRKMSTSWGNVINITDEPNEIFGKIMSLRDELIGRYLMLTTEIPLEEVRLIEAGMAKGMTNPRDAKLRLAREVVALYYGERAGERAEKEFVRVFRKGELPEDLPMVKPKKGETIVELMVRAKLAQSKGEATRLIAQGGVYLGDEQVSDPRATLEAASGVVLRVGKRRFVRIG